MKRIVKWFEINFGWFFVNGRKQDVWAKYLREKYSEELKNNNVIELDKPKKLVSLSEEKVKVVGKKIDVPVNTTRKPKSKKVKAETNKK